MKIKLYPDSKIDRRNFWLGIVNALLAMVFFAVTESHWFLHWFGWVNLAVFCLLMFTVYVFPDKKVESSEIDDFAQVITQVASMSKQLSNLSSFLEHQQRRITDTQATLNDLQNAKTMLEPIVLAQKVTVEAILLAHAARTAKYTWKERLIGFILGVLASMLATMVYEYFKH